MKRLSKFSTIAAAVILQASAQTAYKPPHGPDGHPNLNGIWQAMNTANWNLEDHVAQQSLVVALGAAGAEPGGLSVVEGGKIPYLPAAVAKRKENFANRLTSDPEIKCYLPGVPRATYMPYPFQILQSAKAIAITYEYDGAFRNIFLKDPGPAPVDSWMGQSAGRWEGDTLVVDVTGLNAPGSTGLETIIATPFTLSNATRPAAPTSFGMKRPSRTQKSSRASGKSICRCIGTLRRTRSC
jgi:hypothetical protein